MHPISEIERTCRMFFFLFLINKLFFGSFRTGIKLGGASSPGFMYESLDISGTVSAGSGLSPESAGSSLSAAFPFPLLVYLKNQREKGGGGGRY